jgi:glycosyltransferase involved in cell wall biosynthesis
MRVFINAASSKMGGSVTYLKNLLRKIPECTSGDQFFVYVPSSTQTELQALAGPNIQLCSYPYQKTGGVTRFWFDQVTVPRLIQKHDCDILFSSTGFGTFFSPCPQVLLVRNAKYFNRDLEDVYRRAGRSLGSLRVRRWMSYLSMKQATRVVFPTKALQEIVDERTGLHRPSTIVHYGFDENGFRGGQNSAPEVVDKIRRWRQDGYTILLSVSFFAMHKNFEVLTDAVSQLISENRKVKLITTTERESTGDKEAYDRWRQDIQRKGLENVIIESGYVSHDRISHLYEASDIFLFPSVTESFGHPMVEAMSCGLPVVASDTSVNREICNGAGHFFSPFSSRDCAKSIREILQDSSARSKLSERSLDRADCFSWDRHVRKIISILHQVNS